MDRAFALRQNKSNQTQFQKPRMFFRIGSGNAGRFQKAALYL